MASADVRAAIANYFENASVPGLAVVHRAPPYWADGGDWNVEENLGSGAVGAIHLVEDSEFRMTVPAITGQKSVRYQVGLMLFYQWLIPTNSHSYAEWTDSLDAIIDACKALLRADPNLGNPNVIWQAAQDPDDVRIIRDIPRRTSGAVLSWNVIEFFVTEIITA